MSLPALLTVDLTETYTDCTDNKFNEREEQKKKWNFHETRLEREKKKKKNWAKEKQIDNFDFELDALWVGIRYDGMTVNRCSMEFMNSIHITDTYRNKFDLWIKVWNWIDV